MGEFGLPLASNSAFFGLSKLSVWWLRLGIAIERIKPGNPQQNGRHERTHLTLKKEATKPPALLLTVMTSVYCSPEAAAELVPNVNIRA
jgi:transposase InsO family protein